MYDYDSLLENAFVTATAIEVKYYDNEIRIYLLPNPDELEELPLLEMWFTIRHMQEIIDFNKVADDVIELNRAIHLRNAYILARGFDREHARYYFR